MDNHAKDLFEDLLAVFFGGCDSIEDQIITHNPNAPAEDDDDLHEEGEINCCLKLVSI
jgi:hypothetical protein